MFKYTDITLSESLCAVAVRINTLNNLLQELPYKFGHEFPDAPVPNRITVDKYVGSS
jgi:hypothetical protein